MRLDKFIADLGMGTRSEVKEDIRKGFVTVNNKRIKDPGCQVNTDKDCITYKDNLLSYQEFFYYMMNKPDGVVTATEDNFQKTVLDLMSVPMKKRLFPVGRLDKDTEGLLLITNDGQLAHELLSPSKHIVKKYLVECDTIITDQDMIALQNGIDIGEERITKKAETERISEHSIYLSITEGKFHQVKRMLHALGHKVIYLKRIQMGKLRLDDSLKCGEYRILTLDEIKALKE